MPFELNLKIEIGVLVSVEGKKRSRLLFSRGFSCHEAFPQMLESCDQ